MANIMIDDVCNFKCPYCFANEFTLDKHKNNMTIDNFKKAVDFALSSGEGRIGIIGGEPTLHPQFKEIMEILINDGRVNDVVVFTNGSTLDKCWEVLIPSKIHALVNFNCKEDVGERNFDKVVSNLELINSKYLMDKVTLGINMYKPNFEFNYMIDALKKYHKISVRTSISMPMNVRDLDPIEYFMNMKDSVFRFFRELENINVMPYYDCNLMPPCVTTDEEKKWLKGFWKMEKNCGGKRCNILDSPSCNPVIDISPDLTAIRCFGLSHETKADITKFGNIKELESFYSTQIDSYKYNVLASDICKKCSLPDKGLCTAGCLGYKIDEMMKARDMIRDFSRGQEEVKNV